MLQRSGGRRYSACMSQSEQHGQPPEEDPAADSTNEPPDDGLSLDDLSAAYAQLIDGGAPSRRVEGPSSQLRQTSPRLARGAPGEYAAVAQRLRARSLGAAPPVPRSEP